MREPFRKNRRGAVLALFALIAPVILVGTLGILGFSGQSAARADLQAASNAAVNAVLADLNAALQVSATPDAIIPDIDKQTRAEAVVNSLLGGRRDLSRIVTSVQTNPTTISVTVTAQIESLAGDLFGSPFFEGSATSSVSWMRADQLQIALAIDAGGAASNSLAANIRMFAIRLGATLALDWLSVLPNYPDVAMALVPFTAQIATNPLQVGENSKRPHDSFFRALEYQFTDARDEVLDWIIPRANANVMACFSDPIVPSGSDGSAFGGTSNPLPNSCETRLQAIRAIGKISRPIVNGVPASEHPGAIEKRQRDDIRSAINSIAPAGCRNLSVGVTWALDQLPNDYNPKVIFLVSNGHNSRGSKGRTSECAVGGAPVGASRNQIDEEFVAACRLVRDPERNNGRRLDLIVLQAVDGNPIALRSCATSTDGIVNFFGVSSVAALQAVFEGARTRLVQIAQKQRQGS